MSDNIIFAITVTTFLAGIFWQLDRIRIAVEALSTIEKKKFFGS